MGLDKCGCGQEREETNGVRHGGEGNAQGASDWFGGGTNPKKQKNKGNVRAASHTLSHQRDHEKHGCRTRPHKKSLIKKGRVVGG